ncbi:uncharacterized protein PHALS_03090 [Plasmopara halstedii]|uniref:Uncharacterized protein n=1 Tax=Plasmopara halstedii TaxID=4781 RepID=A0A0P1A8D7_PLAHL|nr:uncharacterized protein PHALS_03090 [Plasmopara halstedii]CEG36542.1 hypothetical protein PHALS_03090 [Plasmopara halstedii]|eukprot:XP_024572911.1 hypothetical protein PHALS_03090 [Plasmopara halstedii]
MTYPHALEVTGRSLRAILVKLFAGEMDALVGESCQIRPAIVHLPPNTRVRSSKYGLSAEEMSAMPNFALQSGSGPHEVNRRLVKHSSSFHIIFDILKKQLTTTMMITKYLKLI